MKKKEVKYKNRYGDIYWFVYDKKSNPNVVKMYGDFNYLRIGYPNIYDDAYDKYCEDHKHSNYKLTFEQFKNEVHEYNDEISDYTHMKYLKLVLSDYNTIDMVDPSGGPYIYSGMALSVISAQFKDLIIKSLKFVESDNKDLSSNNQMLIITV